MSRFSSNEPQPPLGPSAMGPPPVVPVLKGNTPLAPVANSAPAGAPLSSDAERRMAEAIAQVQSPSFRRGVRQQDGAMSGDVAHLFRKPFVARTLIGVLILTCFAVSRYFRIARFANRATAEEVAPAPVYQEPIAPPVAVQPNIPPQPSYPVPAPVMNQRPMNANYPAYQQRMPTGYTDPRNLPGLPPPPDLPGVPDPYARLRRSPAFPQPGGQNAETRQIVGEILRRQEERARQENQQPDPQMPVQQVPPQQMPSQQMPPMEQPEAPPMPAYPPQQTTPPEQTPYNPPPTSNENGGYMPPPRF